MRVAGRLNLFNSWSNLELGLRETGRRCRVPVIRSLPFGTGLILVGSGIYWILSGQLIQSFTALSPRLLGNTPFGSEIVVVVGVLCLCLGLPFLRRDILRTRRLFVSQNGWAYTLPILLASLDIEVTLIGLSQNQARELNPFVAAVVQTGSVVMMAFAISYILLAEGTAVLMIEVGRRLYKERGLQSIPFASVCGVGSFGPASNLVLLLASSTFGVASYFVGALTSGLLAWIVYSRLKQPILP